MTNSVAPCLDAGPPAGRTIDYSVCEAQPGDDPPIPFSFLNMVQVRTAQAHAFLYIWQVSKAQASSVYACVGVFIHCLSQSLHWRLGQSLGETPLQRKDSLLGASFAQPVANA